MTKQVSIIELTDDEVIQYACQVLEERMRYRAADHNFGSPEDARSFLALKLGEREAEVFAVLFLDNRHNLLRYKEMFFGTIDGAAVYPREVVKAALRYNAAAVIFAHNHPSGISEPSRSDEAITRRLREALALVEIRVLDHLVIGSETVSFAERGLL